MRAVKYKSLLFSFVAFIFTTSVLVCSSQAQTVKLLGGNTLNGAVNGTMLGGATMALKNSNDFAPLRVGLGAGTLYGISVGIYDISKSVKGQQYYVSGVFNDGDNSSIIVLLDTFYGAAGGAVVASSFNLIANEPIVEALQYGSGIGAWAGFGFGLIDAFLLSERAADAQASAGDTDTETEGIGIISISNESAGYQVGLLNPNIHNQVNLNRNNVTVSQSPALSIVNLKIDL